MEPKKIILITRCSRVEFLPRIWESIITQASELKDEFQFVWFIAFDTNRLSLSSIDRKFLSDVMNNENNIKVLYTYSSSDDARYGSNIANAVLEHKSLQELQNISHVYLLDDDNTLHPYFSTFIDEYVKDMEKMYFCSQIRLNKSTGKTETVEITYDLRAHNALQWVDSAQILFPYRRLIKEGGFSDGYCIDGLTVSKLLEHNCQYETTPLVAAYYNFYTELLPNMK